MSPIEPGGTIGGRYQLERTIGSGGMAQVWLGHDRLLDRQVAIKILAERYASDPDFVERFRREASAAAGLSHPNIVTVFDRGETDGSYYIVMEHLPGPDLKGILKERGRLEPRQAVDAALQVLAAVGAAHRRNVIHRDIKPQNVLVSEDGNLKVTDFGIARAGDDAGMTEVGSVIGTAQYLSPEQARGEEVTTASDCYSVGILLYEMLTGRVPFDGDKPVAVAMRQINETPVAPRVFVPTLSPQLNDIVMKALEKRPSSRYRTVEEFTQALMAVRSLLPESAETATQVLAADSAPSTTRVLGPATAATRIAPPRSQSSTAPAPASPRRRSKAPLIGVLVALALLGIGGLGYVFTDIGRASKVPVPEVARLTEEGAIARLREDGFSRFETEPRSDANVPQDLVIGTDPEAGSSAEKDDLIRIFISSGPDAVTVPRVVGLAYDDAVTRLAVDKLTAKREQEFSDDVEKGRVIRQSPGGGRDAEEGDQVTLFVSEGPEPVTVPNLQLKFERDAREELEALGLEVRTITRESSAREPGQVIGQDPTVGTKVDKGSTVTLTIATAPEPELIDMPDLRGNEITAAQQKLRDRGFSDATTSSRPNDAPEGTVIDQDPAPGTQVDPETQQVALIFSSGPVIVPEDPTSTGAAP